MRSSVRLVTSVLALSLSAVACGTGDGPIEGPVPSLSALSPDLVCAEESEQIVELRGEGMAPFVRDAATEEAEVVLPEIALVKTHELDGQAASGDERFVVPSADVTWTSQQLMAATLRPDLALPPGVYRVEVTNGSGQETALEKGLTVVHEPVLSAVVPEALCVEQADKTLALSGQGFLTVDGTLPTVHVGDVDLTAASAAGCFEIDGPSAVVQLCTELSVVIPAAAVNAGLWSVSLTNPPPAPCSSSEAIDLLVVPPPVVTSATPDLLCLDSESALVTISGQGFIDQGGTLPTVMVGTLAITASSVSSCQDLAGPSTATRSCTELIVELPAATLAAGAYQLTVINPPECDCSSQEVLSVAVVEGPQVDAAVPDALCAEQQGVSITLSGAGFLQVDGALPTVSVAGTEVAADAVASCAAVAGTLRDAETCTELSFTLPAATYSEGLQDVSVTNPAPAGCEHTLVDALYLLGGPSITSVSPPIPCDPAPTELVISGAGFLVVDVERPAVSVNGDDAQSVTASDCVVVSDLPDAELCSTLTVTLAAALSQGDFTVDVVNPDDGACGASYTGTLGPPPEITAVLPQQICASGGSFAISGNNFVAGSQVSISNADHQADLATTVLSDQSLEVTLPPDTPPGLYDVTVTTPTGCADTLVSGLSVTPVPVVYFVDPAVVYSGISLQVTVYASGILGAVTDVSIYPTGDPGSALALSFTATDVNKIQAVVPAALAAGSYGIVVTDDVGCQGELADAIEIVEELTVAIERVELPFGWTDTRTGVNVYAPDTLDVGMTDFAATPRFYLNPADAGPGTLASELKHVAFVSSKRVSATVPAGLPAGVYDLVALNPDGGVGLLEDAFRVTALAPPLITDLLPASVENQDVQTISVLGEHFRTPAFSATCYQPDGSTATLTGTVDPAQSDAQTLVIDINFTAQTVQHRSLCIVRVTNTDDSTYADYSALGVTNPSLNLAHFASTSVMHVARRALCAAAGEAIPGARFLYAIGGDSGHTSDSTGTPAFDYHDSVEMAAVDPYGELGAWQLLPYDMPAPRSFHACQQLGRFIYLAGGNDGVAAQDTVWRAKILDPLQAPEVLDVRLDIDAEEAAQLLPGRYSYRISALRESDHAENPDGETLAGDAVLIATPQIEEKVSITIAWSDVPGAVAYRVYRSVTPDQPSGSELLLAEVDGAEHSYTDDGALTPAGDGPLPMGALGKFALLTSMGSAREGAAMVAAVDPASSTTVHLYVMGGRDESGAALDSIERLEIALQPDGSQLPAAAWADCSASIGTARWQLGAVVANQITAPDLVAPGESWIYVGGGYQGDLADKVNDVVALKVAPGGEPGAGVDEAFDVDGMQPFNAGYPAFMLNHQIYVFGGNQGAGTDPSTESYSIEMCGLKPGACSGTMPDPPDLANWNNVGLNLSAPRYLHAGVTASAFVFLLGGVSLDVISQPVAAATTGKTLW